MPFRLKLAHSHEYSAEIKRALKQRANYYGPSHYSGAPSTRQCQRLNDQVSISLQSHLTINDDAAKHIFVLTRKDLLYRLLIRYTASLRNR